MSLSNEVQTFTSYPVLSRRQASFHLLDTYCPLMLTQSIHCTSGEIQNHEKFSNMKNYSQLGSRVVRTHFNTSVQSRFVDQNIVLEFYLFFILNHLCNFYIPTHFLLLTIISASTARSIGRVSI